MDGGAAASCGELMKKPTHSSTGAGMPPDGQRGHGPDPVVEEAIGRQLRKLYDDVASEPVPDRFAELLRQLEQQDGKG
jgi:hypothetical protein